MDWVQFKKHVIRYRSVYTDLFCHVQYMLLMTVKSYAHYQSMKRAGVEEWKAIRQYGIYLFHFAELHNLTAGNITEPEESDYYDWSMTEDAISIYDSRKTDQCDDNTFIRSVAQWCRKWYPWVSTQTHFYDAMTDFRIMMKEKDAQ